MYGDSICAFFSGGSVADSITTGISNALHHSSRRSINSDIYTS